MNESKQLSISMTTSELIMGWLYVPIELAFLVPLLNSFFQFMKWPTDTAEGAVWFNGVFWTVNFLITALIYHNFLGQSLVQIRKHFVGFVEAVVLGLVMYRAMNWVMDWVISMCLRFLWPVHQNINDSSIVDMAQVNRTVVLIGTVFLAPLAEECIFRGLIFRGIFGKSRVAAYLISSVLFGFLHVYGYINIYPVPDILIHTLSYLPAGIALGWAYEKADTIMAPVLMHTIINAVAFGVLT